jgi:flagellin-like protein
MKTKMKMLRSKRALSPVIATIILIAVTVAVSLAVAAWMGALTFSFVGSSSVTVTNVVFTNDPAKSNTTKNQIVISIKNTGTKQVSVGIVKINSVIETWNSTPVPCTLSPSSTGTITVTMGSPPNVWVSGTPCDIAILDTSGNGLGGYTATP